MNPMYFSSWKNAIRQSSAFTDSLFPSKEKVKIKPLPALWGRIEGETRRTGKLPAKKKISYWNTETARRKKTRFHVALQV